MTATVDSITQIGPGEWRVEASSTIGAGAVLRWYTDGVLVQTGTATHYDILSQRQVRVDVLDAEDTLVVDEGAVGPGLEIFWQSAADFARYRVEWYSGAAWVEQATMEHDEVRTMSAVVRGLADETVHTLRVVGVRFDAAEVVLATRAGLFIRRPDVPVWSSEVKLGQLTVS